jgi:cytochrome o ubiquinol oxidase operon protein cyoD
MNNIITDRTTADSCWAVRGDAGARAHGVLPAHERQDQGGWTMLSTIFTVIFLAIAISGTLWVMFHMNTNMMPGHEMHQAAGHADHAGHTAPAAVTP